MNDMKEYRVVLDMRKITPPVSYAFVLGPGLHARGESIDSYGEFVVAVCTSREAAFAAQRILRCY